MKLVAKQYEKHIYPKPILDLDASEAIMDSDLEINRCLFWPHLNKVPKNIKLLVAGCGTNQAAYYAHKYPEIKVTGIDLSSSSLQHEMYLKEKHHLGNLRLEQMNLLGVRKLKENFDIIISSGVLHHLENPNEGLFALERVLKDDGLMSLMVYGKYLRLGVYMLQEVFKELNTSNQSEDDLILVRETINSLHGNHVLKRYTNIADDLGYDSGLVDTFLHPRDRAYSVKDIMNFVNSANLVFSSWLDRGYYVYDPALNPNLSLSQRMKNLSQIQKWSISEKLNQNIGTHSFVVRKKNNKLKKIDELYETDFWSQLVPEIKTGSNFSKSSEKNNNFYNLNRLGRSIKMGEGAYNFLLSIDNQSTLDELILKNKINDVAAVKEFMWRHYELGNIEFSTYRV